MKTLKLLPTLLCIVLCSLTSNLFSQDVIFLLNRNEIEAKIIKVEDAEIEYKQWSNQDGPTFTEKTNNIFVIKYQNGEKKVFNTVNKKIICSLVLTLVWDMVVDGAMVLWEL